MSRLLILDETVEYVLKAEREDLPPHGPKPDAAVYILAPLDVRTRARLADTSSEYYVNASTPADREASTRWKLNERSVEVVRHGLKGWRNVSDKRGEVPFKITEGKVDEDLLKRMRLADVKELAAEIDRISSISEQDEKN